MIVPELIMTDVVSTMKPSGVRDLLPTFHYGSKDELNRYLDQLKDKAYPLIWMLPSREDYNATIINQEVQFIIAMNFNKEDRDILNNRRMTERFVPDLLPIREELLKRIRMSQSAAYNNKDYSSLKHPNYRETATDQKDVKIIHYWDALTLSLKMEFS